MLSQKFHHTSEYNFYMYYIINNINTSQNNEKIKLIISYAEHNGEWLLHENNNPFYILYYH